MLDCLEYIGSKKETFVIVPKIFYTFTYSRTIDFSKKFGLIEMVKGSLSG